MTRSPQALHRVFFWAWCAFAASCAGGAGTTAGAGGAGAAGAAGTTGAAGASGAAGTTGPAGSTGAAGTAGTAGATGAAGTTGDAGDTGGGNDGHRRNDGSQGTRGRGGLDGGRGRRRRPWRRDRGRRTRCTTGSAGTPGSAGRGGATGSAGTAGSAGASGCAATPVSGPIGTFTDPVTSTNISPPDPPGISLQGYRRQAGERARRRHHQGLRHVLPARRVLPQHHHRQQLQRLRDVLVEGSRDLEERGHHPAAASRAASSGPNRKGERPHIIRCPATGEFVLYAHAADDHLPGRQGDRLRDVADGERDSTRTRARSRTRAAR